MGDDAKNATNDLRNYMELKLGNYVNAFRKTIDLIVKRIDEQDESICTINKEVDTLQSRILYLEQQFIDLYKRVDALEGYDA